MSHTQAVIEKWLARWDALQCFAAPDAPGQRKFFNFDSAPFPSGALHVGHARNYVLGDVMARFKRLTGHDVLYTTNFDAFGLPNELAAEAANTTPDSLTLANIQCMTRTLRNLGISYDWHRVKTTSDPQYFKWTQWLFLKLFEAGYVYRKLLPATWCESCGTVLADMQVVNGSCWRCGNPPVRRDTAQWFIRLTAATEQLLAGIDALDRWSVRSRRLMRGHIGALQGTAVELPAVTAAGAYGTLRVFVPVGLRIEDVDYIASACGHPAVRVLLEACPSRHQAVTAGDYDKRCRAMSAALPPERIRRRNKSGATRGGFDTGIRVCVPGCERTIPVWAVNHLAVSSGARICACKAPASDGERYAAAALAARDCNAPHARGDASGHGTPVTRYQVHDWPVSRERRWGTPLPLVDCAHCGTVAIPYDALPFSAAAPGGMTAAMAANHVSCPSCRRPARPEPYTLDCYLDDSWCFLSAPSKDLRTNPFVDCRSNGWFPVDHYHAGYDTYTYLHVYRFIGWFLKSEGLLEDAEIIRAYAGHDLVMDEAGKIGKRNGADHGLDRLLEEYGPDALRIAVCRAAAPGKPIKWTPALLEPAVRLLRRFESTAEMLRGHAAAGMNRPDSRQSSAFTRRVAGLIQDYRPHAALALIEARLEQLRRRLRVARQASAGGERHGSKNADDFERLVMLFSVFAPFTCEEIWERMGHGEPVSMSRLPPNENSGCKRP
ncbi:MAG: class I tRNA ligase family protein [Pseudomonadota bacterium]